MLLDEAVFALDTGLRAITGKAIAQWLSAAGITSILVTHDQAEALSFADRVAVMGVGRPVQVGCAAEVYLQPRDAETAGFLDDSIVRPAQLNCGWTNCALGRVTVNDPQLTGSAHILLRPEQLIVNPVSAVVAAFAEPAACYGRVIDIDFDDSVCVLSVQQMGKPFGPTQAPLLVRSLARQRPPVRSTVRLTEVG